MTWINVKDKLPELETNVLVYSSKYGYKDAIFTAGDPMSLHYKQNKPPYFSIVSLYLNCSEHYTPTHWQPLPEPPTD